MSAQQWPPTNDTSNQEIRAVLAVVAMRLDAMRRDLETTCGVLAAAVEAAYRQPERPPQPEPASAAPDQPLAFGDFPADD